MRTDPAGCIATAACRAEVEETELILAVAGADEWEDVARVIIREIKSHFSE